MCFWCTVRFFVAVSFSISWVFFTFINMSFSMSSDFRFGFGLPRGPQNIDQYKKYQNIQNRHGFILISQGLDDYYRRLRSHSFLEWWSLVWLQLREKGGSGPDRVVPRRLSQALYNIRYIRGASHKLKLKQIYYNTRYIRYNI